MKTNCGIYKIINLKDSKIYIGSSFRLRQRKHEHFKLLEEGKHTNKYLQNSYNLHGKINFKWEVIEEVQFNENKQTLKKNLLEREQYWIDKYFGKDCYNFNPIAGSNLGIKLSDETKKKIGDANRVSLKGRKLSEETKDKMRQKNIGKKMSSESKEKLSKVNLGKKLSEETKEKLRQINIGRVSPNKGKKLSEETKEKLSKVNLGKKLSDETKKKIGGKSRGNKYNLGKKHTEEQNKKQSSRQRGRRISDETKKKIGESNGLAVLNVTTNKLFKSISEAALFYNMSDGHISSVCKGKRKTAGGYEWSYLRKENNNEKDIQTCISDGRNL